MEAEIRGAAMVLYFCYEVGLEAFEGVGTFRPMKAQLPVIVAPRTVLQPDRASTIRVANTMPMSKRIFIRVINILRVSWQPITLQLTAAADDR